MIEKDILYFKFAPLTSPDIKRSFSMFKNLLEDSRPVSIFQVEKHQIALIIQCNF